MKNIKYKEDLLFLFHLLLDIYDSETAIVLLYQINKVVLKNENKKI